MPSLRSALAHTHNIRIYIYITKARRPARALYGDSFKRISLLYVGLAGGTRGSGVESLLDFGRTTQTLRREPTPPSHCFQPTFGILAQSWCTTNFSFDFSRVKRKLCTTTPKPPNVPPPLSIPRHIAQLHTYSHTSLVALVHSAITSFVAHTNLMVLYTHTHNTHKQSVTYLARKGLNHKTWSVDAVFCSAFGTYLMERTENVEKLATHSDMNTLTE